MPKRVLFEQKLEIRDRFFSPKRVFVAMVTGTHDTAIPGLDLCVCLCAFKKFFKRSIYCLFVCELLFMRVAECMAEKF